MIFHFENWTIKVRFRHFLNTNLKVNEILTSKNIFLELIIEQQSKYSQLTLVLKTPPLRSR